MSYELNDEEKTRISNIRDYQYAKKMHESFLAYQDVAVGEVFLLTYSYRGNTRYVCHYGKKPTKFFIVSKDEGFIFAKRISATGKLGKEVICMTTSYPLGDGYKLEPDPTYIDSLLLGEKYDIAAEGKKRTSAKNKARTRNNKKIIDYKTSGEAKEYIDSLEVGDMLWTASTTYGDRLVGWQVTDIEVKPTCQEWGKKAYTWQPNFNVRGSTKEDRLHNEWGFTQSTNVTVTAVVNTSNARVHTKTLTFNDFFGNSKYSKWYKEKPVTLEDMLGE
jgi:hypothetical protein